MKMRDFLKEYRAVIDEVIRESGSTTFNDRERELHVMNDQRLYRLAQQAGVPLE